MVSFIYICSIWNLITKISDDTETCRIIYTQYFSLLFFSVLLSLS